MSKKILLADDHQVMREGLRDYVQNLDHLEVIGEAENGHAAIEKVRELSPDLIIMDVGMPGLNGIETTRAILDENPKIKVIGLSMHSDKRFVLDMLKAGASAYLTKDEVSEELLNVIKAVYADELYISPRIKDKEIKAYIRKNRENGRQKGIVKVKTKPVGGSKASSRNEDIIDIGNTISENEIKDLQESEERLRILFEFAPDSIFLRDLEGKFIDVNKITEELTGYKKDELIGKSIFDLKLVPLQQRPKAAMLMERNVLGESIGPEKFTVIQKDGSQIIVEIRTHPVKIKNKTFVLGIARDISEKKAAEEKIKASLKEKDVMLREIHHRVKNNMQIITSFLRIQSREIEDKIALEKFKDCQDRIKTMALIHDDLYRSKDLTNINFAHYISKLTSHLASVNSTVAYRINIKLDVEEIFLDINRAVPCGLIINELLSNALKHAFPDNDEKK